MTAMMYINTNTHIPFVSYCIRELASVIIHAHLQVPLSMILEAHIYLENRRCLTCLNGIGACAIGMYIYSVVAHVPYSFKRPIVCVQQSSIMALVSVAIPLKLQL